MGISRRTPTDKREQQDLDAPDCLDNSLSDNMVLLPPQAEPGTDGQTP